MSDVNKIITSFGWIFERDPTHNDLPGMSYKQGEALNTINFYGQSFACVDHKADYDEFITMLKAMPSEKEANLLKLDALLSEEEGIMWYGVICNHDDQYLCEHRKSWIINFVRQNFCQ